MIRAALEFGGNVGEVGAQVKSWMGLQNSYRGGGRGWRGALRRATSRPASAPPRTWKARCGSSQDGSVPLTSSVTGSGVSSVSEPKPTPYGNVCPASGILAKPGARLSPQKRLKIDGEIEQRLVTSGPSYEGKPDGAAGGHSRRDGDLRQPGMTGRGIPRRKRHRGCRARAGASAS